jgi:hypothetical protein
VHTLAAGSKLSWLCERTVSQTRPCATGPIRYISRIHTDRLYGSS